MNQEYIKAKIGETDVEKIYYGNDMIFSKPLFQEDNTNAYEKVFPNNTLETRVNQIGGKSIVFNQLAPYITESEYKFYGGGDISEGVARIKQYDNTNHYTIFTSVREVITRIAGHKYYTSVFVKSSKWASEGNTCFMTFAGLWTSGPSAQADRTKTDWQRLRSVTVSTTSGTGSVSFRKYDEDTMSDYYVKEPMIFDLTQMFGAGNEPTIEQFEAMFPNDYYPYSEPTLQSVNNTKLVVKGKNILDIKDNKRVPIPEVGNKYGFEFRHIKGGKYTISAKVKDGESTPEYIYLFVNGANTYFTTTSSSLANPVTVDVKEGSDLFIYGALSQSINKADFDRNFNKFEWIQLEYGSTVTPYAPHREPTELTTDFGILRSAGSVYDYIDFDRSIIVRRVGAVDLGSLSYYYWEDRGDGVSLIVPNPNISNKAKGLYNLICEKYPVSSASHYLNILNNEAMGRADSSAIYFRDDSITNANAFKSAMQGVMLYYELAEPIEEPITIPNNFKSIIAEGGGTITFKNDTDYKLPVPNTITNTIKTY